MQGCGAVPASLVVDTKLGLTQEFLRQKPELGGLKLREESQGLLCASKPCRPAGLQDESQALVSAV